eukprot:m.18189 g.18189  ORF g.18189 m.18189 type:complete len:288 (+) comp11723_c0_seq1:95-958(+)
MSIIRRKTHADDFTFFFVNGVNNNAETVKNHVHDLSLTVRQAFGSETKINDPKGRVFIEEHLNDNFTLEEMTMYKDIVKLMRENMAATASVAAIAGVLSILAGKDKVTKVLESLINSQLKRLLGSAQRVGDELLAELRAYLEPFAREGSQNANQAERPFIIVVGHSHGAMCLDGALARLVEHHSSVKDWQHVARTSLVFITYGSPVFFRDDHLDNHVQRGFQVTHVRDEVSFKPFPSLHHNLLTNLLSRGEVDETLVSASKSVIKLEEPVETPHGFKAYMELTRRGS